MKPSLAGGELAVVLLIVPLAATRSQYAST